MNSKAQAAMEFLMTYGWAILVVLVAIGALSYFGVLSPDKFLPERCTGPAGMDCVDKANINAPSGKVTVAVRNNLGFPITLLDGNSGVQANCGGSCAPKGTDNCLTPGTDLKANNTLQDVVNGGMPIRNNEAMQIQWNCVTLNTGRFKSDLSFWYVNNETGLFHKATYSIRGSS